MEIYSCFFRVEGEGSWKKDDDEKVKRVAWGIS
jgi:hypothetical protein